MMQRPAAPKRPAQAPHPAEPGGKRVADMKGSAAKPVRARKPVEDPNAPGEEEGDVLAGAQIDVAQEQAALLGNLQTAKAENVGAGAPRVPERVQSTWVNVDMVEHIANSVLVSEGLSQISPESLEVLVRGVEAKFEPLIKRMATIARRRTRRVEGRPEVRITSDVRR